MDKYQQLENRIKELEKQMKDFQQSSSIPLNMIKSLEERGFVLSSEKGTPEGAWYDNAGFTYEPVAGVYVQTAANIYLKIQGKGNIPTYYIPLLSWNEAI